MHLPQRTHLFASIWSLNSLSKRRPPGTDADACTAVDALGLVEEDLLLEDAHCRPEFR